MHPRRLPRSEQAGFSYAELAVVLVLIAALAGVVTLRSGRRVERDRVAGLVELVRGLRTACAEFHRDTGEYAREYDRTAYGGPYLELSSSQPLVGWDGPYIRRGLVPRADNPFGGLHLYDVPTAAGNTGFDLDGDGTEEMSSSCCMLYLAGIDEEVAEALDARFDRGVTGPWTETGRVKWSATTLRAYVLVYY